MRRIDREQLAVHECAVAEHRRFEPLRIGAFTVHADFVREDIGETGATAPEVGLDRLPTLSGRRGIAGCAATSWTIGRSGHVVEPAREAAAASTGRRPTALLGARVPRDARRKENNTRPRERGAPRKNAHDSSTRERTEQGRLTHAKKDSSPRLAIAVPRSLFARDHG